MTAPAPPTRRAVLCAAGGCLLLAACTRQADAAEPAPAAAASTAPPSSSPSETVTTARSLARGADVRAGVPLQVVLADGRPAFLVRTDEGLSLLGGTCTHAACAITWQSASKVFLCPCHLSQFDLAGKVRTPPATEPLPRIAVQERNGSVYLA